jgi:hypothetical protein
MRATTRGGDARLMRVHGDFAIVQSPTILSDLAFASIARKQRFAPALRRGACWPITPATASADAQFVVVDRLFQSTTCKTPRGARDVAVQ